MLDSLPNPAALAAPASDYWATAQQAEFLGHLAATGSAQLAAKHVGMSARAAHDPRHRADGAALHIAAEAKRREYFDPMVDD